MAVVLILVIPSKNRYSRYEGKKHTCTVLTVEPLTQHWVEMFRIRPDLLIAPDEPEAA